MSRAAACIRPGFFVRALNTIGHETSRTATAPPQGAGVAVGRRRVTTGKDGIMRPEEFTRLTDQERSDWEAMVCEEYEESGYAALTGEDAFDAIQGICEAALAGDFKWMLRQVVMDEVNIARHKGSPAFRGLLRRAYEHAVASGDAGACCNLGNMYHETDGTGPAEDYAAAAALYELGADRGDVQSSVNLGYIYYYGRGTGVDYARAYECFSRAALSNGHPEALYKLGDLYAGGRGVRRSDPMAWRLYSRALENAAGSIFECRAAHHVADYLMEGVEGTVDPDPERALELYVRAELGYYAAIDAGLDYYGGCLGQAIEGQSRAREAVAERHRRIRAGGE